MRHSSWRTLVVAALTMCAFAANSLLCRAALGGSEIDPAGFTAIRLASGALTLWLLARPWRRRVAGGPWDPISALGLFGYAVLFSFAYVQLSASTGALILFPTVQITMIAWAIARGERPRRPQWLGIALALGGLFVLSLPGLSAPPLAGFLLMVGSGVSWGIYSLRGRRVRAPLRATASNFVLALPLVLLLLLVQRDALSASRLGVVYAVLSGSVASGLGYAIWYLVLPRISPTSAAVSQLTVPVLAALGGVALLGERISPRLAGATLAILVGVALTLFSRTQRRQA